eukprot:s3082_g6.t1
MQRVKPGCFPSCEWQTWAVGYGLVTFGAQPWGSLLGLELQSRPKRSWLEEWNLTFPTPYRCFPSHVRRCGSAGGLSSSPCGGAGASYG